MLTPTGGSAVLGIRSAKAMVMGAGMSWSGFRPSDDQNTYGYNVPGNMYAAASLERVLQLNAAIWRDEDFEAQAAELLRSIRCNNGPVGDRQSYLSLQHALLYHSGDRKLSY